MLFGRRCCSSERRTGIAAPDVQNDYPRSHVDNPSGDENGIQSEKYGIQDGPCLGDGLRKEKIEDCFPEKDEHDGNSHSRAVQIGLGIGQLDGIECEQRVKEPGCEAPKKKDTSYF